MTVTFKQIKVEITNTNVFFLLIIYYASSKTINYSNYGFRANFRCFINFDKQ